MMAALRIDLRVFCNHITKNFQVKHDQCNSIIFLKHFLWKALNNHNKTLDLLTPDYSLLKGPGISPMFIIELHVLQSLFVRGSNKNKGVGLFQISSLTYINQVIILQCGPPSCTLPKKVSLSTSV